MIKPKIQHENMKERFEDLYKKNRFNVLREGKRTAIGTCDHAMLTIRETFVRDKQPLSMRLFLGPVYMGWGTPV